MRRICLRHPFVHMSFGSCARSQNIKTQDMKIPPKLSWNFTPLYSITKLKSANHRRLEWDLFDALKAPVPSVCLVWLLSDKHKHSKVKNSGRYFHPSIKHHQPTIRKAWRVDSRPIWCPKSSGGLHLSIGPLVVEIQAQTSKIPHILP